MRVENQICPERVSPPPRQQSACAATDSVARSEDGFIQECVAASRRGECGGGVARHEVVLGV